MRLVQAGALLVLAATPTANPPTLEGDWETLLASPKRPWIFLVGFKEHRSDAENEMAGATQGRLLSPHSTLGTGSDAGKLIPKVHRHASPSLT